MKIKEAFRIMQLDDKDPEMVKTFKRMVAFLYYLKPGEELDLNNLRLKKIGDDVLALDTDIKLNIHSDLKA